MRPRRKHGACVHCRQMKLGCDAPKLFPASCSRCAKQKLRCSIDPSFKRVPRKERMDALEKELKEIKQRLVSSPVQDAVVSQSPGASTDVDTTDAYQSCLPPVLTELKHDAKLISRTIGDVELDPLAISVLLEEYYSHYHHQFPLIVQSANFLDTCESCPLLFWTVMTIAARERAEQKHLYPSLTSAVQTLASTVCPPSDQSLLLIQALLLLCYWSLPFGPSMHDCSWSYCGLATNYSLLQGLHRPSNISDFAYNAAYDEAIMNERRKTWLACYIVNQRMSTRFGLPNMAVVDHSILAALADKPSFLPEVMYHQLHIAHQGAKFCNILGNNELTTTGLLPNAASIIQMFDKELRALEARFKSRWRNNEHTFFMGTKLQLYSFALAAAGPESANAAQNRTEIFAHAYITAMTLIQSALESSAGLPYWTEHQLRHIVDAVFFLLKLLGSGYEFVDKSAVRNTVGQVWQLLHSRSQTEDDHPSRVCSVIEYLTHNRGHQGNHASVSVKSRMAGNLAVDSAWCARNRFSETVKAQRPLDYTLAAGIEKSLSGFDGQPWLSFFGGDVGEWECFFEELNAESLQI